MNLGIDIDNTLTDSYELVDEFLIKYYKDYLDRNEKMVAWELLYKEHSSELGNKIPIKPGAKEVISKLHDEGFRIIFITARSDKNYDNAQLFCENYLRNNNIYFDKVITNQKDKLESCINEEISIMIDDEIYVCEKLEESGIHTILYNAKTNIGKETYLNKVYNWDEVYNSIHEYVKNKNNQLTLKHHSLYN